MDRERKNWANFESLSTSRLALMFYQSKVERSEATIGDFLPFKTEDDGTMVEESTAKIFLELLDEGKVARHWIEVLGPKRWSNIARYGD